MEKNIIDIHVQRYLYTNMEYSIMRKKEILPFATAWMALDSIMLSEISQRKSNTAWYHLFVESKKKKVKLIETE